MSHQKIGSTSASSSSAMQISNNNNVWCPEKKYGKVNGSVDAFCSLSDPLDIRLLNEQRLHEMREQGKKALQQREELGGPEEGAANLLARFHNFHWKRQHHIDNSQQVQMLANREKHLVPVNRDEEDYFPGTRQPKKCRKQKITKNKPDVIQLEEVVPTSKTILPAGYQTANPPPNAWALRKGTDLFDHCKLTLTIHGPDDSDELYQRAIEESLITLREEQDRVVNMYSGFVSEQTTNTARCSWVEQTKASTGAGDGAWMQEDVKRVDSLSETKPKSDVSQNSDKDKRQNYGANLPENSSYDTNNRSVYPKQQKYRSFNEEGKRGEEKNLKSNTQKGSSEIVHGNGRVTPEARPVRLDAGDCYTESRGGNVFLKDRSQELCERNEEAHLESLGFSKAKIGGQRRTNFRGQNDLKLPNNVKKNSTVQGQEIRKAESKCGNGLQNRNRHISFSDPLVQEDNRHTQSIPEEDDPDPWIEKKDEYFSPTQIGGARNRKPEEEIPQGNITTEPHFSHSRETTVRSPLRSCGSGFRAPLSSREENATKDSKFHGSSWKSNFSSGSSCKQEAKTSVETESDEIKRMREQIQLLDEKVRSLSCALGESSAAGATASKELSQKPQSGAPRSSMSSLQRTDADSGQVSPGLSASSNMPALMTQLQHQQLMQQQLAHQQHYILQGAATPACPSAFSNPVTYNWLVHTGGSPVTPTMNPEWLAQMGIAAPAAPAAPVGPGSSSTLPTGNSQEAASVPQLAVPGGQVGVSLPPQPAAAPIAQSVPGAPVSTATPSMNQGMAVHAHWLAQYTAWQQMEQQRLAQFVAQGLAPGAGVPMPSMQLPSQQAMQQMLHCSVPGMAWQASNTVPTQYEGDWVISPHDEARLEQGLLPSTQDVGINGSSSDGNLQTRSQSGINGCIQGVFPDPALSPTGSVRALGLPLPSALKPARPPAHLVGLKSQNPLPGSVSPPVDLSAFNPSRPPPESIPPKGVRQGTNTQLDEPRGRGRLR